MVADATRLSQFEARELQMQPAQTRGVPQMLLVLNSARRNNRLYVRNSEEMACFELTPAASR